MARPSDYTEELGLMLCELIAEGHSLRSICEADAFPDKATVFRWLAINPTFRDQYRASRDLQQDSHVDEMVYIADNEPDPQKARVRIWARQWVAARMAPKRYGDRIDINPDEDRPMHTVDKTDGQRAKAMAALLAKRRLQGQ